jgi:uncharacterized membrane protein YedE/YeeE
MLLSYLLALVLGILFGFALNKGGLTKYANIVGVFRFTNLTVIKFMLTTLVVAMTGLYILQGLGLVRFPYVPTTYIVGNLVGGLIFGAGMSLTGYCPGTCVAGSGEGKLDYFFPGVLGLMAGSVLFGLTYEQIFPPIQRLANLGNRTLPQLWNIDPLLLVGVFVILVLFLFYLLEHRLKRKDKLEE